MKKSLFFYAAATALMLTACSSEDDILQTGQTKKVAPQEVGFDVYTSSVNNVTRAGYQGALTTSRLQDPTAGFGVYAFYSDQKLAADYSGDKGYAALNAVGTTAYGAYIPNFMVNEKITWNNVAKGWEYSPLKYWPNETVNDSQSSNATMEDPSNERLDRLTFFAYAPYVATGAAGSGITAVTGNDGKLGSEDPADPAVSYQAEWTNPNNAVDLLWGVAPSGGLSYTAVNGTEKKVDEGMPLIDMVKPGVNTSMKFLFNHALARIGIKVVAAVDQLAAGGTLDPNTRITVKSVKLTGYFGQTSSLNLNNTTPKFAKWYGTHNTVDLTASTAADAFESHKSVITIDGANIASHLRYIAPTGDDKSYDKGDMVEQTVVGVTTTKQDLITPSTKYRTKVASAPYDPSKFYYSAETGDTKATASYEFSTASPYYTYTSATNIYTQKTSGTETAVAYPGIATLTGEYYSLSKVNSYYNNQGGTDPTGGAEVYTLSDAGIFTYVSSPDWNATDAAKVEYHTIKATKVEASDLLKYTDVYSAEPNFYMVIPVENIPNICTTNWASSTQIDKLRTVTVQIEYYITTEDSKLVKGRTQSRNIVTKDVVFPSIANGKSYNLNLILGLTSVKFEAEVDDWKVENVNGYLPQNTAD